MGAGGFADLEPEETRDRAIEAEGAIDGAVFVDACLTELATCPPEMDLFPLFSLAFTGWGVLNRDR